MKNKFKRKVHQYIRDTADLESD